MSNSSTVSAIGVGLVVGSMIGFWSWVLFMAMPFYDGVSAGEQSMIALVCGAFGGGCALAKYCELP